MSTRKRLAVSTAPASRPLSFTAPVGGWNARDPQNAMPATDAIYLENLIPDGTAVNLRQGCRQIAVLPEDTTAAPHVIRTLLNYSGSDGGEQLFAACEDGIYDVTAGLVMPTSPASVASPDYVPTTSNAAWEFINVTTAGGAFLLAVNGTDNPILYNGTTWTKLTGTSTPPMSGPTLTSIATVMSYKSRLYFTVKDSLSFWYSGVGAIAGALSEFPLSVLCRKGGYLLSIMGWTYSTQFSVTERIAMVTSEGQVVIYEGYDPSNSAYWSLVGVYDIPKPLGGRRCLSKIGADVGVLTKNGLILLSKGLREVASGFSSALTDKIRDAFREAVGYYEGNNGWEMANASTEGLLFINVPQGVYAARKVLSKQLVLSTANGGWCTFSGWNPTTITSFGGKMYYANRNKIYRGLYGQDDDGAPINIRGKTAFMAFSGRGYNVRTALVRANFTTSAPISFKLGLDTDFETNNYATSFFDEGVNPKIPALWDIAKWDENYWDIAIPSTWKTVNSRPGGVTSLRFSAQVKGITLTWNAVDCIVTVGGML